MKLLFGFLFCGEMPCGQSVVMCSAVLKGFTQGNSEQLSLQKGWHLLMNLMDHCLTFSIDHEKVKDSIQLVVDES